jgi:hypothetical protein
MMLQLGAMMFGDTGWKLGHHQQRVSAGMAGVTKIPWKMIGDWG